MSSGVGGGESIDDVDREHEGDGDGGAAIQQLRIVVEGCFSAFPPTPSEPTTWVSFGLLDRRPTLPFEVTFASISNFVNAVGVATVEAGLVDVQFSLTKRTSKTAKDLEAIFGIVVDVDRATADALHEVEQAGVPMPNFMFSSLDGFKMAYVGTHPIVLPVFDEMAKRITLAFEGGDAMSWEPSQMQRLPTCLRMMDGVAVPVAFHAALTNAVPFEATVASVPFPFRVRRALGSGALAPADRKLVREYLDDHGIPAAEDAGSMLYASCPAVEVHGSACCYVNTAEDGEVNAHCLGGHDGEGAKHWSETQLADLAGAGIHTTVGTVPRFDPRRHLPVTSFAVKFVRFRLSGWPLVDVDAVVHLWTLEWARRDKERLKSELVDEQRVREVYRQRLQGVHGLAPMRVYYERGGARLVHDDPEHRALTVSTRNGPSLTANAIELKSTALWQPMLVKTAEGDDVKPGWGPDAVSLLHKLAVGHGDVLAKLGVPAVTTYSLPVAHVSESWTIQSGTHHIEGVTVRETFGDVEEVDALGFFLGLFEVGRIPLASENDVRLFVLLLATPLLRHIAPGLLGVAWFQGPPGAGKDFMAEMARHVWEACAAPHTRVSFDISLAGDLEQKRMIEMGAGCVFARAKEAGKRPGMADALIRLAGTDVLPGRGLYKEEIGIPNTFTYVAESAEDVPDRREIARRTTLIRVSYMADAESKGRVLDEVRAASKGIIKNLKRLVETRPPEWYLQQSDTGSRPVVPVALAHLLGATLAAVEGEDLTEVYEAMAAFIESEEGAEHGRQQLATMKERRADKVSLEAKTLPSYGLAFFIDRMIGMPGKAELFSPYNKKSRELVNRIQRETDYRTAVAKHGYMAIEIRGRRYALRVEDGRRFILLEELDYHTEMTAAHAATAARREAAPSPPIAPETGKEPEGNPPTDRASRRDEPTFHVNGAAFLKKTSAP